MNEALSPKQVEEALRDLPNWHIQAGKLVREIRTRNWRETLFLVNGIAALAESANHHPDLEVTYRTLRIGLWTHETGGLTERDLYLARTLEDWLNRILD